MTDADWIGGGVKAIGPLCEAVGLAVEPDVEAPDGVTLWSGAYAAVAFWPTCEDQFVVQAGQAEAWFADYLYGAERRRNARVVDGYLLLAFAQPVAEALNSVVRSVELSTQICRKHAVWPDAGGAWPRLDAVTVLGLPTGVTAASSEPAWPALDAKATSLWARIQQFGPKRVAEAEDQLP